MVCCMQQTHGLKRACPEHEPSGFMVDPNLHLRLRLAMANARTHRFDGGTNLVRGKNVSSAETDSIHNYLQDQSSDHPALDGAVSSY